METVAVVGPGQMGVGICQIFAAGGYSVLLAGRDQEGALAGKEKIAKSLDRAVANKKITPDVAAAALDRVNPVGSLQELSAAELVIEAVPEIEEAKAGVLKALSGVMKAGALLATNTSSISVTRLARYTADATHFVGMHFFNPAPAMSLVEIVRGLATSDDSARRACAYAEGVGKVTVEITDSPGFVVNRLLIPMLNEAVFALSESVASVTSIDAAVKLGLNHPMGPLALADYIGLDTCLEICRVLHARTGDQKFRPAPLLVNFVEAGWLGRKSGRGFYDYTGPEPVPTR